ncbi:MAG: HlyD family secretion protein [Syntrophomonadaceae bacterium]
MRKKIGLIVFFILLTSIAIWLYLYYSHPQADTLKASGTIEATTVDISARISGTLVSLNLQEGQTVEKGQIVAELSRSDLVAQKERDAMAVMVAQANLENLRSGARRQELEQARSNVNIAQINLAKAQQDLDKIKVLAEAGAVSQDKLDETQNIVDQRKYQLEIAQAQLSLIEAGNRPQTIAAAEAELERNKAILQASQSILDDLKLAVPISGTILSRNYEPGEYVQAGSSLATIADLNNMWIKVYIPIDDLPQIKLGQKVYFTISGDSQRYSGTIINIASQGEFTPKTIQTEKERTNVVFAVKIGFNNKNGALKIGMPADVVFGEDSIP